jgi:hypothetical protein
VTCELSPTRCIEIPVIPGILKHPTLDRLPALLEKPNVVRKYTIEALRKAAWPVLAQFPRDWLKECLPDAPLSPSRRRALVFLLS